MLISVAELFGKNGESLTFSLTEMPEKADVYSDVVEFLEPVKLEGKVTNEAEEMHLLAEGHTVVSMVCSRCLTPVRRELTFPVEEVFVKAGIVKEETETFSGDQIDLADFVKRGILGALPMKVLCKEDCKGLCPVCGKDLNDGDCGCDTTYIDPRFESLRALFHVDEEV